MGLEGKAFRMVKWSVSIMVIMVMSFSLPLGAEERELPLEEALELLEEHSIQLQVARLEFNNAQVEYEQARAEQLRTESRLQRLYADLSYQQAQQQYRSTVVGSYLQLLNDYQQLKILEGEVNAAQWEMELLEAELQEMEEKVAAGHRPRIELLQKQIELNNTSFQLDELLADQEKRKRELKNMLKLDQLPSLVSAVEELDHFQLPDEDKALERVLKASFELELASLNKRIAQVELERGQLSDDPELTLTKLKNNVSLVSLQQEQTEIEVKEDLLDQLHMVRQARRQVDLVEDNLEQAEEHLRITSEQYEVGLVSQRDAAKAELEKLRAVIERERAINDFLAVYLNLQEFLGEELEVIRDEILVAINT